MERRIRLGICEQSARPGGPSRYVGAILKGLDPGEFDVTLFGDRKGPYAGAEGDRLVPLPSPDRPADAELLDLLGPGPGSPLGLARRAWRGLAPPPLKLWAGFGRRCRKVGRIFRWRPVDLLHAIDDDAGTAGLAARLAGVPRVLGTLHADPAHRHPGRPSGLGQRALDLVGGLCLDRAIAVSEATGLGWSRRGGISRGRIETIRDGVDVAAFRRRRSPAEARELLGLPATDGPVVGAVGRLDPSKGVADLLDAAALLAHDFPGLSLVIAGDGPLRASLADRARRLGIAERVHFLGFLPDVAPVYEALDVYALPSTAEGLPSSLLEAMATSLPAVGSAVGAVPEAIVDGSTGYLVPPGDPRSIASALRRLLQAPGRPEAFGRAARARVERDFDEAEMIRKTIGVYRDLLAGSPPPPDSASAPLHGRSA